MNFTVSARLLSNIIRRLPVNAWGDPNLPYLHYTNHEEDAFNIGGACLTTCIVEGGIAY
jgi:hypothetical protein